MSRSRPTRPALSALSVLLLVGGLAVAVPASAQASPDCSVDWGSTAKTSTAYDTGPLVDLRTGTHACYDRLVIDLEGDVTGYTVRYDRVEVPGSGEAIALEGGADIEILVEAPGYDEDGDGTYLPADPDHAVGVSDHETFRQVAWGSSFEGQSVIGLGVRARLPMRVFTLDGPGDGSRIVVDVAHHW